MMRNAPGPRALPVVGHVQAFLSDKLGFLLRAAADYGDVVRLEVGRRAYLLSNPEDIRHVLATNADNYEKTRRLTSPRRKRFFGDGVVTAEGEAHQRQRRVLQPLFHGDVLTRLAHVIAHTADEMLATWQDGGVVDVHAEMLALTQRITARVLLGADYAAEGKRFTAAVSVRRSFQEHLLGHPFPFPELLPTPLNRSHARADRDLDQILDGAIQRRRAAASPSCDLLSLLVQARYGDGSAMSDGQIRDEARTLTVAGYETIAEALTWTWYLLARAPSVETALRAEVDRVLGDRGVDAVDARQLHYCRMVLAEAMRLYPPSWIFVRVARGEDLLPSGARIPGGSKIYLSPWVMHRHPCYFPNPDLFDPQRFGDAAVQARPRFTYFPFGGGRRRCIGEEFAWMEGVLLLAAIAGRFGLRLAADRAVEPDPNVTLRPKDGLIVELVAR